VLLAYAEDEAGGLMSPRFVRARPDMTVDEAIRYVRRQAREREVETIYYVYVLDANQRLLGVVSFRELLTAPDDRVLRDLMETDVTTVGSDVPAEDVARLVAREDLLAVPVLDAEGRMQGIVTVDDVVDVVQEEATEDIHKLGGMEALDVPYMQTRMVPMLKKRGGWLSVLFLGELLTATAMTRYEHEIARAVVLTIFIPLIISSGGNAGSQAATLVIRAMALGEVKVRDWWRVVRRELAAGLALGTALALLGFARVVLGEEFFGSFGEHTAQIAATVGLSLVGVVTLGTLAGSIMPLLLERVGFDPASASAPFVATVVDVSGLVIYFSVAQVLLRGSLL
jgi:magnesium transporter